MSWVSDAHGRKAHRMDPAGFDRLSDDDRRLIDDAVAAGRVQRLRPGEVSENFYRLTDVAVAANAGRRARRVAQLKAVKAASMEAR